MDEAGIGKHLEENFDSTCVRRRFENEAFRALESEALQKVMEGSLPAGQSFGRKPFQVEILLALRRVIRKCNRQIGGGQTHQAKSELVLLRTIPTNPHVIHGAMRREEKLEPSPDESFRQEEMIGIKALVSIRVRVSPIESQQFMQKGCSGSPMPKDKQRGFTDRGPPQPVPIQQLL